MPHGTFGIGKDVYQFEGTITFDGRTVPLVMDRHVPMVLICHADNYYLLTHSPFAKGHYRWFRLTRGDSWEKVDVSGLPTDLWLIRFGDPNEYCWYRGRLLSELAESGQDKRLFECFTEMHSNDPRFVYSCSFAHEGSIFYFLDHVREHRLVDYYEKLVDILEQSKLGDNHQMIQMIASTVYALKPDEAREFLCQFREKIKKAGDPRDNRLVGLGNAFFKSIGCTME